MNKIKPIRSFVKRFRKFSANKQKAFDESWKIYGLDLSAKIGATKKFTVLEIGFGDGQVLFDLAQKNPEKIFIGIEVHQPGISALFAKLKEYPLNNIHVYNNSANTVIPKCVADDSLDKVLILFPDPWPKTRHHKRRLIQPEFIELLQKKLKKRGILHIATDWEDYAKAINKILENNPSFLKTNNPEIFSNPAQRPLTKFEQRGIKLNHKIFELFFINLKPI